MYAGLTGQKILSNNFITFDAQTNEWIFILGTLKKETSNQLSREGCLVFLRVN